MIKIEDTRLRELLESRKQYIGSEELPIDAWFADICFIITFFTVEFKDTVLFPGIVIRTLYIIVFIIYTILLLLKTVKVIRNPYTCENLYKDIENASDRPHAFSLIILRNSFEGRANRYLLLYDQRWSCFLFPYCSSGKNEEESRKRISAYLSRHLGIPTDAIKLSVIDSWSHEKYSVSDKVRKHYDHTFYEADTTSSGISSILQKNTFKIDGYRYRWFTIAEMQRSTDMMRKNDDIINHIRSLYGE